MRLVNCVRPFMCAHPHNCQCVLSTVSAHLCAHIRTTVNASCQLCPPIYVRTSAQLSMRLVNFVRPFMCAQLHNCQCVLSTLSAHLCAHNCTTVNASCQLCPPIYVRTTAQLSMRLVNFVRPFMC